MGTLTIVKVSALLLILIIHDSESASLRNLRLLRHERISSLNNRNRARGAVFTTTKKPASLELFPLKEDYQNTIINYDFEKASSEDYEEKKTILPRRVADDNLENSNNFITTEKSVFQKITFANLLERAKRRRSSPITPPPSTTPLIEDEYETTTLNPSFTTLVEFQTMSAMIVTRNVTSTRLFTTDPDSAAKETTTIIPATDFPSTTTEHFLPTRTDYFSRETEEENSQLTTLFLSSTTTSTIATTTTTTTTTATTTTTSITTTSEIPTTTITSNNIERVPKKINDDSSSSLNKNDEWIVINSGQYHEKNPGQYHEDNPGQYHEENPGQYHEDNPGQYHEENPGQYHEENPGQYHEENPGQYVDPHKLEIRVKHTNDTKVYNVQSKVNEFIIGEYGTISKESGETINGVRYTAVDDSVDPSFIYDTLLKYFKF